MRHRFDNGGTPLNDERSSELNLSRWWLALCGLVTLAMIAAAWMKGGYMDEYYTFSFAKSSVALPRAFEAWSRDSGHPVGFYALSRIGDLVLPADVFVRRLSNLLYFALALVVAWSSGKGHRSFGSLYLASLAAGPYVIERFAEYRSTFLGLMIIAIIVIRLRVALGQPERRSNFLLIALLAAWLGFIDYPLALTGIALCAAWAMIAAKARDWSAVWGAAAAGAACIVVIAASILNGARFRHLANPYFETFPDLVRDLAVVGVTAVVPCLAMLVIALIGVRRERAPILRAATRSQFSHLLLLALIYTTVGLILVNADTHSMIRRQIFGIVPLLAAYLTEMSLPYLRPRPVTIALIGANLVAVSAASAAALTTKRNFDRYGPQIARAQRSCATLPVYAILPEKLIGRRDNRFHMPDQFAEGLTDVAHRYRFRIRMDVPQRGWIDRACGAMFWTEAAWLDEPPTPQSITSKLGLQIDPRTLQAAKLEWVDQDSRKQYSMLMRIPAPGRQ